MRLYISDIPKEGLQREEKLPVAVNDSMRPGIAHVAFRALRIDRKVLVEGLLKIDVSINCSRCLKEFSYYLDTPFKDEYCPAEELGREEKQELSVSELDLSFYAGDELDITELIKEQILLSVPMKPLCSPHCRGICLNCGKDLNEGLCECRNTGTDPRLAPLSKLKNR